MRDELHERFDAAMRNLCARMKSECGFKSAHLLQGIRDRGGFNIAKILLGKPEVSATFTNLWECGCLRLSVECLVLQPDFRVLFSEGELQVARKRLRACEFDAAQCEQ